MTDHFDEDRLPDELQALLHETWAQERQTMPGRRSAHVSLEALSGKIAAEEGEGRAGVTRPPRQYGQWIAPLVLAGMAIVLGMLTTHRVTPRPVIQTHLYTTAPGQRAQVQIADGSHVILGPVSRLVVSTGYSTRETRVTVTGQGLFMVHPNAHAPLTVMAGHAITRVLGTTFMVRRYTTETATRVLVVDGRVSVATRYNGTASHQEAMLGAGMLGTVNDSGRVIVTSRVATDEYTSWANGTLVFRDTPVAEIVAELSRAYGAEIQVGDSVIAAQTLTWTVPVAQRSLSGVLDALSGTLHAHVVRAGRRILIVSGQAAASRRPLLHPFSSEMSYGR